MTTTFQHKKVIIAGGTSGIGKAAAKQFANEQAQVTITGRNPDKLKMAEQEGFKVGAVDSTNREALDEFFKNAGGVDHLVVTLSGSKGMGNFSELSLQTLRDGFEEKFWAHLHTIQAAFPYLNKGGSITLVTAISATAKMPGTAGLAALNGALEIMVPVLAKELTGIRVNAVSPGVVDTSWWDFLPEERKQQTFKQFAKQTLAGRVARPEEIADVIVFLAANDYITGQVIACDGGLS
ncbi:MAG: SDR family oxidoreductase [Chitinophagaceae bacterium]|nr:SDR family oxidoreductase [Chitinophagaceae bacterium]